MEDASASRVREAVSAAGIELAEQHAERPGIAYFDAIDNDLIGLFHEARRRNVPVLALAASFEAIANGGAWRLLHAGAADTLVWTGESSARQIRAKLDRWSAIEQLASDATNRVPLIGSCATWRDLVRRVVEAARFADTPVLLIGESGTGKELLARLIHLTVARADEAESCELVTVDCSTIVAELSGSEFFGHEKGAFTGAVNARDGAFADADGGTLFLDEVGELPPGLQAQLLRAVQEKTYKRVGGNVWQTTNFRLVSATNRDLNQLVERGLFRLDLFHRLAGWVFRVPSLSERREDILPLAEHFLRTSLDDDSEFDSAVSDYLVNRDYAGNIRELRQLVLRIAHRHAGPGPITAGDIPPEDRPAGVEISRTWPDEHLEQAIANAIARGVGLKEISQATTETAIRIAVQSEKGNLQRAARRLGVTDRALQMRRASKKAGT
jgi:transcriptional regulator with GAF, ATPase, and Fis domain